MSWLRGQQFWAYYTAWDVTNGVPKTGDKANHTIKIAKDGSGTSACTNSGDTNNHKELANGEYSILITSTEAGADTVNIYGVSSTSGVVITPVSIALIRLPNVDPAASGGLPTVDSNNTVKIQAGTGTGQISLSSGAVTIGTNNDKTGYSLSSLDSTALHSGTAQAGGASTITLAAGASSTTDLYKGNQVKVYSSTGAGQTRTITAYDGSTKVATVDWAWTTQPDSSSLYAVLAADGPAVNSSLAVSTSSSDPWGTAVPGSYTSGQAGYILGNRLDVAVSGRAAPGAAMALTSGERTTLADVILDRRTIGLKKNTNFTALPFVMIDASTGQPVAGKTVTVQRKIDGGSFATGALTNIVDAGSGLYTVDGDATDVNGTYATIRATATGCFTTLIIIVTTP